MISNCEIEIIELTPKQKANLRYYNKMKSDPKFIERQRIASTKHYNKIKNNETFKLQVSEQKKTYHQKLRENKMVNYFPNVF